MAIPQASAEAKAANSNGISCQLLSNISEMDRAFWKNKEIKPTWLNVFKMNTIKVVNTLCKDVITYHLTPSIIIRALEIRFCIWLKFTVWRNFQLRRSSALFYFGSIECWKCTYLTSRSSRPILLLSLFFCKISSMSFKLITYFSNSRVHLFTNYCHKWRKVSWIWKQSFRF